MADYSHLKSVIAPRGPQTTSERVEPPAGSAHGPSRPTPPFGAPSLGFADRSWGITSARIAQMLADLDPDNERIDFPIHADRAFGEAPEGGAR